MIEVRTHTMVGGAVAALLLPVSLAAQPADEGEISLDEIEEALGHDAAARAESQGPAPPSPVAAALASMNPDISVVADVALAYFSDDEPLQTGAHDPRETGFALQQVELALGKAVDPYFRVDGSLVFSESGVELEEMAATTLALPWNLQARVGLLLTRFGRLNATHPHAWDFVDQPFALGRVFGGEGNRGVGAELSYLVPLPWYVEVIGSVTDAAGAETARSFYGADDLGVDSPLDVQATAAVEQFFALSPNWSLLWGVSAATGPNATGPDSRTDVYGTDLYIKYRPITRQSDTVVALQAEYIVRRRQIPRDLLSDHGGYAYLFWKFARRWGTAARYEYGAPAKARGGEVGLDPLDPAWTDHRHRVSASVTFWPSEFSRLRWQASLDVPTWRDDPIAASFLSFEFHIGAHGAHEF